jgi:CspA family cold shock protein
MEVVMKGKVKSYSSPYGYGFVIGDDGDEYFVHWTFILMQGFRFLSPGERVEFDPFDTYRGKQARNIHLTSTPASVTGPLRENPFTPQAPVTDPAKFAGRKTALGAAARSLFARKNIFVIWERGVGKSSLCSLEDTNHDQPALTPALRCGLIVADKTCE